MSVETIYPVIEQIARVLTKRLERMTTGLYPTSPVTEVVRAKRNADYSPHHYQIVLTQNEPEFSDELSHPGNPPASAYYVTFTIRGHLAPSETDEQSIDAYRNVFAADIRRAVATSLHWYNFDGWAVNAWFEAPEAYDADGGISGVNVPVRVLYRHDENDPYKPRA